MRRGQLAVLELVQFVEGHVGQDLRRTVGPTNRDLVDLRRFAQAERHGKFDLREITLRRHDLATLDRFAGMDFDDGADRVAIRLSAANELEANPMMAELLLVAQEPG